MKTKVIASVLAGVMGVQSVAMATSRVDAVGSQQIAAGQADVSTLLNSFVALDNVLAETASSLAIRDRDTTNRIFDAISVGSATVGVAVGVFAAFLATGKSGSGPAMILMGSVGAGLTAVSAISGGVSDSVRNNVSLDEAQGLVKTSIENASDVIYASNETKEVKNATRTLRDNLFDLQSSLEDLKNGDSKAGKVRILRELTQVAAVALSVAGMSKTGTAGEKVLVLSAVLMNASNLVTALKLADNEQAEGIIKEIKTTRTLLKLAQGQLK